MYNPQIKTFIQVADKGSFSKAAEGLFITPASVMKQMNALEGRLGLKLLSRTNQGIELTDAGRYIYSAAKRIIAESEDAVRKAKSLSVNKGMWYTGMGDAKWRKQDISHGQYQTSFGKK